MLDPSRVYAQTEGFETSDGYNHWNSDVNLAMKRGAQASAVLEIASQLVKRKGELVQINRMMLNQNIHGSARALELAKTDLSANLTGQFGNAALDMMQKHKEALDKQVWFE
ncbi:hypothetical protein [Abiotrophia defectiva]